MDHSMGDISYQGLARVRNNHRAIDLMESQALLWELGSSEPTLQQCFKVIESTCLSQGIECRIKGQECNPRFQRHLDRHYIPFLKSAMRAMVIFGFVPWRVRRVGSGDQVPEVLPCGTFDWHTETGPGQAGVQHNGGSTPYNNNHAGFNSRKRKLPQGTDDDTRLVVYRVIPTAGGVKEEDVHVYIYSDPAYNVESNSVISATVPSPLAHILTDYKNLRNAQIRRSYADAWNTTAHIISTFRPNVQPTDDPNNYLLDFQDARNFAQPIFGRPVYPSLHAHNWFERDMLIRRQIERPSTHRPQVYTLPRDHDVTQQVMLTPCEDLAFLWNKFQRDVTAVTGVPYEMVIGRQGGNADTIRKTMASGRLFSTNMHEYCRHLEFLLTEVYCLIYRAQYESVEFKLTPMPRLEVESVSDFKTLFEIGALTPDMSIELSQVLLGKAARPYARVRPGRDELERPDGGSDLLLGERVGHGAENNSPPKNARNAENPKKK